MEVYIRDPKEPEIYFWGYCSVQDSGNDTIRIHKTEMIPMWEAMPHEATQQIDVLEYEVAIMRVRVPNRKVHMGYIETTTRVLVLPISKIFECEDLPGWSESVDNI